MTYKKKNQNEHTRTLHETQRDKKKQKRQTKLQRQKSQRYDKTHST
jgi:hypothetical protein